MSSGANEELDGKQPTFNCSHSQGEGGDSLSNGVSDSSVHGNKQTLKSHFRDMRVENNTKVITLKRMQHDLGYPTDR